MHQPVQWIQRVIGIAPARWSRALVRGLLLALAIALIAAGRIFEVITPPVAWMLLALVMAATGLTARAEIRRADAKGDMSAALRRYNTRFMIAGAIYMLAMVTAGNLHDELRPGSPAMWLAAIAPILPVLGMIWTVFRYYAEETDEYLRHRAIMAALTGLALVLVLGTVWGFLEMFELVGHVWNWWVFPAWAIGMGLGMCRTSVRDSGE